MNGERPDEATADENMDDSVTAFDNPSDDEADAMVAEIIGAEETTSVVSAIDDTSESSDSTTSESDEIEAVDVAEDSSIQPGEDTGLIDVEMPQAPVADEAPAVAEAIEQPSDEVPAPFVAPSSEFTGEETIVIAEASDIQPGLDSGLIDAEMPQAPVVGETPAVADSIEQPSDEVPAPLVATSSESTEDNAVSVIDDLGIQRGEDASLIDTEVPQTPVTEEAPAVAEAVEQASDEASESLAATVAESEVGSDTPATHAQESVSEAPLLAADAIVAAAPPVKEEIEQPSPDTPIVVATELTWGFIDTEGRVHQKTTETFRGRVIGRIHGGSGEPQIAEFESNFGPLAKEVEVLESDVTTSKNKGAVLGRVRKMKATASKAEALGDFDDLFGRLNTLETSIQQEIDERRAAKEALIVRAEEMKDSTDWKVTGEAFKDLFQEWKQIGATGREADDSLWARFIAARELFNTRRSEHFNLRQEQWENNRLLKQDLIVRAHELSTSDQWRQTSDALRSLFDEWKKIGSAGRQSDEELWQQFRAAQQHFYDRRSATWDDSRSRKETLCQRAEDLRESTDWDTTVEDMKGMMADWKSVGTTGKRDVDDALWNRFRAAQNAFFDKRYAEASSREQEERSKLQRKEEIATSIEALGYSADAVAAAEQATALRAEFETLPPLRKDREEGLQRRIRKAMGDIRVNAAAEGARRAVSWQGKLREALERSQDQIDGMAQTVQAQEAQLVDLRSKVSTAGPDEKEEIERQIQELNESISYNQAEIDRLRGSMTDIEASVS